MFKKSLIAAAALSLCGGVAMAEHKEGHTQNNAEAPGQDRVCLVTTSGGEDGDVIATKWLPRAAAEAQADEQTTFIGENPDVQTEEGCENFDLENN